MTIQQLVNRNESAFLANVLNKEYFIYLNCKLPVIVISMLCSSALEKNNKQSVFFNGLGLFYRLVILILNRKMLFTKKPSVMPRPTTKNKRGYYISNVNTAISRAILNNANLLTRFSWLSLTLKIVATSDSWLSAYKLKNRVHQTLTWTQKPISNSTCFYPKVTNGVMC